MIITRQSLISGITRSIELAISQEQLDAWQAGDCIQDVMPELSNEQREFIMTGITQEEWDAMPEL